MRALAVGASVAAVFAFFAVASAPPAPAATPVPYVSASPDVTVTLGVANQVADNEDVAVDNLAGIVMLAPLGALPSASNVSGYELFKNGDQLVCFDTTVELPGAVIAQPGDVVRYASGVYSIEFAAAANGVPAGTFCDAIATDASGKLLLSFDVTVALPGGVTAEDEDLARLDSPGAWSLFFDGSAAGIAPALDVDGAHRLENGNLALSFDVSGQLGGVDFDDEDVVEYDGSTWSLAYDGSAQDPDWAAADTDAIALPEPGMLLLLGAGIAQLGLFARLRARP
jgi:hypothetical protein